MKIISKFGLATLAAGAFWAATLPGKAETPDTFTRHGLPIPGAYFAQKASEKPATIAVSKSGQGVGEQKQTSPDWEKARTTRLLGEKGLLR